MRAFDVIGVIAVSAWITLVGAFVWTNYFVEEAGRDLGGDVIITEGDSWMILTRDDTEVGFVHETRTPLDPGWLLEYDLMMNVSMLGAGQILETQIQSRVDESARLVSFTATIKAGVTSFDVEGEVEGTDVVMRYDLGGGENERRVRLQEPPRLSNSAINQLIARDDLEPGATFEQEYFDPTVMGMKKMKWEFVREHEVDVFEEKIDTFHFRQMLAGTELDTYVDERGEVYIQEFPLRIIGARMPKQLGRSRAQAMRRKFGEGDSEGVDLSDLSARSAFELMRGTSGPLPGAVSKFELRGPIEELDLRLDSGEQEAVDRTVDRVVIDTGAAAPQTVLSDDERLLLLASSPRVDHDHDELGIFVEGIDPEGSSAQKAEEIARRVNAVIKAEGNVGVRSASGIIADPRGDCTEHALLLVTALRRMGIPARFVHGVKRDEEGKLVPHVWAQYWDGERFVDLDATTASFLVGSEAVQLYVSPEPDDARLLGAIEQLEIVPVAPEPDPDVIEDSGETFHK